MPPLEPAFVVDAAAAAASSQLDREYHVGRYVALTVVFVQSKRAAYLFVVLAGLLCEMLVSPVLCMDSESGTSRMMFALGVLGIPLLCLCALALRLLHLRRLQQQYPQQRVGLTRRWAQSRWLRPAASRLLIRLQTQFWDKTQLLLTASMLTSLLFMAQWLWTDPSSLPSQAWPRVSRSNLAV